MSPTEYQTAARVVEEVPAGLEVPLWLHPEWDRRFPWLIQGTTGAGSEESPFDLGLAGKQPVGEVLDRWRALRSALRLESAVHSRQVHGADLQVHEAGGPPGLWVMDGVDGHLTNRAGLLLSVSVADCIPVSVVDPESRAVALVHAGWRGVAGAIAEKAVRRLNELYGSRPADLWLHCGPAICGDCYEVGPEVHEAVWPESEPPAAPTPIDLRRAVAQRVADLGVPPDSITISAHCTRCGPGRFFSHRGGAAARQMGVLGIR